MIETKGGVLLQKYSLLDDRNQLIEKCAKSLYQCLDTDVIISDRDTIIAAAGRYRKYRGRPISKQMQNAITDRRLGMFLNSDVIEVIHDLDPEVLMRRQAIAPIIINQEASVPSS